MWIFVLWFSLQQCGFVFKTFMLNILFVFYHLATPFKMLFFFRLPCVTERFSVQKMFPTAEEDDVSPFSSCELQPAILACQCAC